MNVLEKIVMTAASNILAKTKCYAEYGNAGVLFKGKNTGRKYMLCFYDIGQFCLDEQEEEDVQLLPEHQNI